ncbi:MAG TPA: M14 family zinc carboxypeptidase [Bacteroidales bacterium]|nr:M14 family zinc carboxypeptidase [Bacteroidales bacterium]
MRKYILLIIISITCGSLSAQNFSSAKTQQAIQILQERGEINIKFNVADKAQINEDLTNIMSISNVKPLLNGQGFEVQAYANAQEFQEFLTRNISYEIIPRVLPKAITMATTVAQMAGWNRYPIYSVYEQMMANFATNYPTLCDIDTILAATPSGNYRILVAKISDNVNTAENEPQFLFSSSMHGNETAGFFLTLRMIDYLLTNYGSITQITNLINGAELWICPLANPEGTYYNSSPAGSTVANARRANLAGVDLNRNYPDPRAGQNPDGYATQAETQAFITFANNHHFNMAGNFHGGTEVMNYPWDTWTTAGNPNADAAWWERVCTNYVTTGRLFNASYMTDTYADGVTEGGDWYVITGGRQDYMNYYHQCREVTMEVDVDYITPVEDFSNKWNENYQAMLNYMQESLYGIRGIITDSCSGEPIRAKVFANSYDQANDSSHVYSALPVGNYHKYVNTGTYSVTFSAPGYTSKTITGISVTNGSATVVNVALAPAASPDAQFTGTITDKCTGTVQFINSSTASTDFVWFFGDGATSTELNPTHTYTTNGTYTVKLRALNCKGKDSLVMTNYITINMAEAPTTTGGSVCGSGSVILGATGSGTISWYNVPTGGTAIGTGTSYTTPNISTTTTYYADNYVAAATQNVGPAVGGASRNVTANLIFDVYETMTLISVQARAGTAGNKTITLLDNLGATVQTASVYVGTTTTTVTLNWVIAPGTGYQLNTPVNSTLYRLNSGVSYPYSIPGLVSITGCDVGATYYYSWFNWSVQGQSCRSTRIPATATVLTLPVAGFTSSVTDNTADFTNTSADATSYFWNFGDASTSTDQHPSHTYTASGTYNVMLIATNGSCADTTYQDVVILPGSTGAIISGKTRYAGRAIPGSPVPNFPTYDEAIYDIDAVIVKLTEYPGGTEVARDTSDALGNYQFTDVADGNYLLWYDKYAADTMQWGNDINAIDLAQIKYLITSDTVYNPSLCFSGKYKAAANVDNNAYLNAIDVARIKAKIGSPADVTRNFPKGNWVAFDTLITVAGSNIDIDLKTICYGDFNASSTKYYGSAITWGLDKSLSTNIIATSEDHMVISDPAYFEIPLRINSKMNDFSALGLELNYPADKYKLVSAFMPKTVNKKGTVKINPTMEEILADNSDLLVTENDGIIRVVYATTDHFDVAANDDMIVLGFRPLKDMVQGELEFNLSGTGVIGNKYGEENDRVQLLIPKVFVQGNSDQGFEFSGYPNPFCSQATISYNLPENGQVHLKVYNAIGEMVSELLNESQESGPHSAVFTPNKLSAGLYTFKLEFTGKEKSTCLILKMFY